MPIYYKDKVYNSVVVKAYDADEEDSTVTASDIAKGVVAYSKGTRIVGTNTIATYDDKFSKELSTLHIEKIPTIKKQKKERKIFCSSVWCKKHRGICVYRLQ